MQPSNTHLTPERLAAFDDAPFTADEQAHLAHCGQCRDELEAVRAVVALAGALGHMAPAPDAPRLIEFDRIMAGLDRPTVEAMPAGVAEQPPMVRRGSRPSFAPLLRRAAAAVLLVGGGALAGRLSNSSGGLSPMVAEASVATPGSGTQPLRATATPASLEEHPFADRAYGSVDEATAALFQAQRDYERASLWLASNDTTMRDPEVFRARLAALDQMMEASRVALRDAPQDPVLNHYYLAAYSAREATLQALGGALPVDKTIERY